LQSVPVANDVAADLSTGGAALQPNSCNEVGSTNDIALLFSSWNCTGSASLSGTRGRQWPDFWTALLQQANLKTAQRTIVHDGSPVPWTQLASTLLQIHIRQCWRGRNDQEEHRATHLYNVCDQLYT